MQQISMTGENYWENLWAEARKNLPGSNRLCRSDNEMIQGWERRAHSFAANTGEGKNQQRRQAVISRLEDAGAIGEECTVLDVGAGPGNYALPLAAKCRQLTALEPAGAMVQILGERAEQQGLNNIGIIQKTWQEIDLEKEGMYGKYDLVFASMTPGVRDPETLDKLIRASRKFCYLSAFSGQRWSPAQRDLWQALFHEDPGDSSGDIIYPLNLLYAWGYRPSISFSFSNWVNQDTVEEAVDKLCRFFWSYMDITTEIEELIRTYVSDRAVDGIFQETNRVCQGMMLWRVDEVFKKP